MSTKNIDLDENKIRWYHAQYRFSHPAEQWIDIFLIEDFAKTILPLLDSKEPWRFHRRSNNDEALHQLTFYYRGDEILRASIVGKLIRLWSVDRLKEAGLLIEENHAEICDVRLISDPSWPFVIQMAWPYFIKGVCEMFVKLIPRSETIDECMMLLSQPENRLELSKIKKIYELKNQLLQAMYKEFGCHAFFHHIGAVFGGSKVNLGVTEVVGVV
jgi:hypothetical protein